MYIAYRQFFSRRNISIRDEVDGAVVTVVEVAVGHAGMIDIAADMSERKGQQYEATKIKERERERTIAA